MSSDLRLIRAFIAIRVPEQVRRHIERFQTEWQTAVPGNAIRWTPTEQIHLTLRFLGNLPPDVLPGVEARLSRACEGTAGFEVCAAGSGCFPNAHRPRVLWIGVGGDLPALAGLQSRVLRETAQWGETEGREFRAHLTIGRVKDAPPRIRRDIVRCAQTLTCGELGRWRVDAVWLMRSELSAAGASHTALGQCPLRG